MRSMSTAARRILADCLGIVFIATATSLCIAAGAAAAPLLFVPHNGKFPYHLSGPGGATLFETVGGSKLEALSSDYLLLVLRTTLFNLRVEYLKVKEPLFGGTCHNDGKAEAILANLLGHLGFSDPGTVPAVLLLFPSGFEYECDGGLEKFQERGAFIGLIAAPSLNTATELMHLIFKQTGGKQEPTTFLLGNEILVNRFEEISLNGGAIEQQAHEGEAHLSALPGQGTFLLVSP